MDLSVVIVSYNVREYLRTAIKSVLHAAGSIEHEIIVVDNCSGDGSADMVRREFSGVTLINPGRNEGFAAACNRGIDASSGEFVLILNPDTLVDPKALAASINFMREHPEAGAVGARLENGEGRYLPESKRGFPSPLTSFFKFSGLGRLFPKSSLFNAYYLGDRPDDKTCEADILTGSYMFIRKEALNRAGLFDTSFFLYGEDIDMSWRIVKSGYRNYYLPAVRVTHFKGKSAPAGDPVVINHFYDAMVIFTRKYFRKYIHLPIILTIRILQISSLLRAGLSRMFKKKQSVVKKG